MSTQAITTEQIAQWKKKHGEIFKVTVGEYSCVVRKPTRAELGYASKAGASNPLKFNEVILNACFLGGNEEIKTDDELFLSASAKLGEMINIREAELKKL